MLKKGSKLYSIFLGKCPKCHKHGMYVSKNPYMLNQTLKMHERCQSCNTKYKMEPSFFYGAMYVSYALGVLIAFGLYLIGILLSVSFQGIILALFLLLAFLTPPLLRLSRNIWINLFIHYKGED